MAFWGHICKPGKRYEQEVENAFQISQAALELVPGPKGQDGAWTSLIVEVAESGSEEFIVCHLNQAQPSQRIDLTFDAGEKITLRTEGPATMHLTGSLQPEEDLPMGFEEEEDMVEESESEDEVVPALVSNGVQKKRKNSDSNDDSLKAKKSKKEKSPLDKLVDKKKAEKALKAPKDDKEVAEAIKKAKEMSEKIAKENPKLTKKQKKEAEAEIDDGSDDDSDDLGDEEIEEEEDDELEEEDFDDDMDGEEEDSDVDMESPKVNGKKAKENGVSPQKGDKTPKKGDKTPKKGEKTPKKEDKTPKKEDKTPKKGDKTPKKEEQGTPKPQKTPKRTLKGGIQVEDLKIGSGPEAKRGKMVGMFYDGRLATNNKRFDSNLSGDPFKFKLGLGEVIKGWDLGVEGMKVGGKRKLTIPPKMAYGSEKTGGIPPNSTLVFEVECKYVK